MPSASAGPWTTALGGAIALAVGLGIGRFAFTPLLPMMLQDGVLDLQRGSWLASANYLGYLAGALACMALPRRWDAALLVKAGLLANVLLTLGMALPLPALWLPLRFLAGAAGALVFVQAGAWCLARLATLGAPALGGAIYIGPGIGIAASGLVAIGLGTAGVSAAAGWAGFALLGLAGTTLAWPVFRGTLGGTRAGGSVPPPAAAASPAELALLILAYGLAGFGYIITATYLPVIARQALPGSAWLDAFWPILGVGVTIGALLATRVPIADPRRAQPLCFTLQAIGVALPLFWPGLTGFILASLLVGLPFTAITYFAMQEARRLRPQGAARLMALMTVVYGLGQIAGPPLTAALLDSSGDAATGFALSLGIAAGSLLLGAVLFWLLPRLWPAR